MFGWLKKRKWVLFSQERLSIVRKILKMKYIIEVSLSIIVSVSMVLASWVSSPYASAALANYDYRKEITIDGTVDGAQTDYQMRLVVHEGSGTDSGDDVYLNGHVREDFYDVRFTQSDGSTEIDFWREKIIKSFDESGCSVTLYGVAVYPQAYYYNGNTYVVFSGDSKDPYIMQYNHTDDTWTGPVKVGSNPLADGTDDHGAPAVIVDNSGYIHVIGACHNTALKYWISDDPEDISDWTAQDDITTYASYPRLVKDDSGYLYVFYRGHTADADTFYQSVRISTDGGDSWSAEVNIIDYSGETDYIPYAGNCELDSTNDITHMSWCRADDADTGRLNVYHAYYKISDGHMYNMAATDLGTTISVAEGDNSCLVVNSGADERNIPALHLDSSGNPYIICPAEDSGAWKAGFVYYNSGWQSEAFIATIYDKYAYPDFIVNSSSDIEAYLVIGSATETHGDIDKYTYNGSWSKDSTIADADEVGNSFPYGKPNAVVNGANGLRVVFASTAWGGSEGGGEGEHTDNNKGIFGLDSNDYFVGQKAVIWIEFNSIAASPSTTNFYLYYGNALATDASDGEATFLFFDDFDDVSIDTDKWDGDTGEASLSDSVMTLQVSEDSFALYTDSVWSEGLRAKFSAKWPMQSADESPWIAIGIYATGGDSNNRLRMSTGDEDTDIYARTTKAGVSTSESSGLPMFTYWGLHEMLWQTSGTDRASFSSQERTHHSITTNIPTVDLGPYIYIEEAEADTVQIDVDWVFVGKFTETEPTWGTWGNEESDTTVTTNAATNKEDTTATLNGTVDDDGENTVDYYGFVWDDDSDEGDPGNVDPSGPAGTWEHGWKSGVGDYGENPFDHAISGLPTGTVIYFRAAAHNTFGWVYGECLTFLTKPAAPTNVSATDGVHETKVVITWTKSTGATDYHVWRDAIDLGGAGDVATFDDNGATAGTITSAGNVTASDGTSTAHVTLSLAGETIGHTSHTYKVVASNATGDSDDSATDDGYRVCGAITYQWQQDAGGGFGNIAGATTDPYNDTTAPAPTITPGNATASDGTDSAHVALSVAGESGNNGASYDYQCICSSTNASNSPQTSDTDTGYRGTAALGYEWYRSAGDADAGYGSIAGEGGTIEPYNDSNGAIEPDGRWYYCEITMSGAVAQDTDHNRGYRASSPTNIVGGYSLIRILPIVIASGVMILAIRAGANPVYALISTSIGLIGFYIVQMMLQNI